MPSVKSSKAEILPNYQNELTLEEIEKQHILAVLQQENYNKSAAARRLGIARKTLREKLLKYKIDDETV